MANSYQKYKVNKKPAYPGELINAHKKMAMGKGAKKSKLERIGHELKVNPPKILAKTRAKKGAKQANKQRVAILLSKAGMSK